MGKKIILSENKLKNIVRQSIMEYFHNNMDGFTSTSTMDVNNINANDEDREREMDLGERIVDLEDFYPDSMCYSNSAYGIQLVDDDGDRYGEPKFPYKPYLGLYVQGEHPSNLGEVFIAYGENLENCKTIQWKDMTDRMKDDVEELVYMAWESGSEELDS